MSTVWVPAYVAIGSNLDDPLSQVRAALVQLAQLTDCRLVLRSPLYRSAPLGQQDQPDFINAVVGMLTSLQPLPLLHRLKALEQSMGRLQPVVRWGPRRIDLDLLMHGDTRIVSEQLTLPHPGVPTRNFVLYPWCAIAPELQVPGLGRVRDLAGRVAENGLKLVRDDRS
jgi:2-amino-4-hydroxy-6-hydroxymethyldihydropteridine diphosphokinase